ncbi:MAG: hypothetical protein JW795_12805 [Chitinivibrionales bacterium]|nr:hypothetical protein [Chitinivibrionales bacterium]
MVIIRIFILFVIAVFLMPSFGNIPLQITYKTGVRQLDEESVKQLVFNGLKSVLAQSSYSEGFVHVYDKNNDKEQYLVVTLLKPESFGIESFRLDVYHQQIVRVTAGYLEEEPLDPSVCGTCPDPELQVVISWATDFKKTTEPSVQKVDKALTDAKIKHVVLVDAQESKSAMLNYLSCPKLAIWGRVGHGATNGSIMFGYKGQNGNLTTKDVTSAPFKDVIKGKYFPFNSCFIGGNKNTFGKGLITGGAVWMCGGDDVSVSTGSSEPVWANFLVDVCTKNAEVIATFDKYMKTAKDKWRYQSQGTGPYYPFQGQTQIALPSGTSTMDHAFSIHSGNNTVTFLNAPGKIVIYSLSGKSLVELQSLGNRAVLDLNGETTNLQTGVYIAAIRKAANQGIITSKIFRIAK